MNIKFYKYCIVPQCKNTTNNAPEKLFIYVPENKVIRRKWLTLARRLEPQYMQMNSGMYFCEDHFDLPNDMENYMQYHIMGSVSQIRMKPGCVPSKFECQPDRRKWTCGSIEQAIHNEQQCNNIELAIIHDEQRNMITAKESLDKSTESSTQNLVLEETFEENSDLQIDKEDLLEACKVAHKSIQVLITHKYRSKAVQVKKKLIDRAVSPIKPLVDASLYGPNTKKILQKLQRENPGKYTQLKNNAAECALCYYRQKTSPYYTEQEEKRQKWRDEKKNLKQARHDKQDFSQIDNKIKVFCQKCNTGVSHTAEGIQEDQTKLLIAKVYHYFEREYEELKTIYADLDLTPLSKFRQRTALATGVSETTVLQILKEEEGRNADKRHEPPVRRRRARKRSRQTDSSSEEDSSDDNDNVNEQSSNEAQTVVVKIEPLEYYNAEPEIYFPAAVKVEPSDIELNTEQAQTDPISLHVKTEPRSDVVDNTDETIALNEPARTKRKGRKIPRSDVTPTRQHPRGDSSTAAAASSVRVKVKEEVDESSLFGDTKIKVEEIEIHEEGPS